MRFMGGREFDELIKKLKIKILIVDSKRKKIVDFKCPSSGMKKSW